MSVRIAIFLVVLASAGFAQEIPLGTWRTHFSYDRITSISETSNFIFASGEVGLFAVEKSSGQINKYSSLDGLQGSDITALAYDGRELYIGFGSGNMDIITAEGILNLDFTSDSQIIGSKAIRAFQFVGERALIATDYGILDFDTETREIRRTYRELGENAEQLGVRDMAIYGDSLFIVTARGWQASALEETNLADFRNWRMFSVPGGLMHVIAVESVVYFQSPDRIYSYEDQSFQVLTDSGPFKGLTSDNGDLVIFTPDQIVYVDSEGNTLEAITDPAFEDINEVVITGESELWVGDDQNGLLSERNGEWLSFSPSGPVRSDMFSLQYSASEILAFTGGYGSVPFGRQGSYSAFNNGLWTNVSGFDPDISDVSDGVVLNDVTYLASAGSGMLQIAGDNTLLFDETNSPLQTDAFGRLWVTDLTAYNDEVYVVNHASPMPLHKWDGDSWESYDNLPGVARFALEAVILSDVAWMRILRSRGGGLQGIDMESGETRYLSEQADEGSLASRSVFDLSIDKDGFLWLGTARGVSVLFNPLVLDGPINAVEPVFDGRPLLVDREVYAIAVDGGNRKWMGTDQGAWLFDPLADELIVHFTSDNSPLPSNNVIDIAVDGETGEVFFLTDAGLASYRAAATEAGPEHESVKIFPNPVRREFQGSVGISGLSRDAIIKITDVSGKLIYQTQANGGTAAWPIRNSGNLATGVYLVFSASSDGEETYIGKIAVIN